MLKNLIEVLCPLHGFFFCIKSTLKLSCTYCTKSITVTVTVWIVGQHRKKFLTTFLGKLRMNSDILVLFQWFSASDMNFWFLWDHRALSTQWILRARCFEERDTECSCLVYICVTICTILFGRLVVVLPFVVLAVNSIYHSGKACFIFSWVKKCGCSEVPLLHPNPISLTSVPWFPPFVVTFLPIFHFPLNELMNYLTLHLV